MPLRSEPEDAAVADAFGTLSVVVGVMLHTVEIDTELLRDHLGDLGEQALPHLGAAVVQVHGAIVIDVHQGPGLVEYDVGERNAELDRRQRDAALEKSAPCVECGDGLYAVCDSPMCFSRPSISSGRTLSVTRMP